MIFLMITLFALGTIALGYLLWVLIILSPTIKHTLSDFFKKNGFVRGYLRIYGYRTVVNSILALSINILFITLNVIVAIRYNSIWYATYALIYTVIVWMRVLVVLHSSPGRVDGETVFVSGGRYRAAIACLMCGIMIILSSVVMGVAFMHSVFTESPFIAGNSTFFVIASAVYTLYRVALAIFNIIRAGGRKEDVTIITLRSLMMIDALFSIPNLIATLLNHFGKDSGGLINSFIGLIVSILAGLFGIYTLICSIIQVSKTNPYKNLPNVDKDIEGNDDKDMLG